MTTKITLNNIADTALATLTGPKITTIVYPGDDTATDTAGGATINLTGGGFQSGCSVLVSGTASSVVTFISSTQISFIAPALSAGTYVIYVINPDGGTAISIPGISYSGTPNWTTTAGSLGTAYETGAISSTLTATGDAPITYTLASGTLPTGSTLASDGTLSGTAPATASATTYTFTVSANDAQNQTTNRSFSLTINPDVVIWSSPSDNTTYTVTKDSVMSNVTMSATSAAGGSITYTADTLPTGLSINGANIAGTPTVAANTTTILTATSTATRTATKTINWVVNVGNDNFFKYTTMLLQGASTTFVDDASTNNFAVTINGDTKPNGFNPYTPGYYSNYFATNEQLTSASIGTSVGTGDFSMECWVNVSNAANTYAAAIQLNVSTGFNLYLQTHANTLRVLDYNNPTGSNFVLTGGTIKSGTWYHILLTRQSGTIRGFINGNLTVNQTGVTYNYGTAGTCIINSGLFPGNISNARVILGNVPAAYQTSSTTNGTQVFTPSTTPLTAVSGTILLTGQSNRFVDNSTNALAFTLTGSPKIQSFNPFTTNSSYSSYGSGYFDGSGDYISVASNAALGFGTSDFTVECWVYTTATPTGGGTQILDTRPASTNGAYFLLYLSTSLTFNLWVSSADRITSSAISLNTWYHISVVRSSGTTKMYINGVQAGSSYTDSTNYLASTAFIGASYSGGASITNYLTGYITDFRIVKGTAVYTTAFTPPTAPLTAIANTSLLTLQNNQSVNNNVFLDNSTSNFLVTRNGNTTQGTFSPYGGNWSTYIPSAGNTYITAGTSTNLALGAGNFTFESWLYLNSLAPTYTTIFDWRTNGSAGSGIPVITDFNNNGTLAFVVGNGSGFTNVVNSSSSIPVGSWFHLAVVRNSTTVTMYFNGTSVGSGTSSATIGIESFNIGNPQASNYTAPMYVSNVRLVKGTAVYTGNFTPSTTPLTAIANTQLLTCQSSMLIDNSPNNFSVSKVSTISVQRFSPFNPASVTPTSYSGYFDGTGDYLTTPYNAAYAFGTGDFTVEFWINHSVFDNYELYIGDVSMSTGRSAWAIGCTNALEGGSSKLYFFAGTSLTTYGATWTPATNTWYHIAASRSGTSLKLFVNGTQLGSTFTCANDIDNTYGSGTFYVGKINSDTSWYLNGYMSNLRVVKGTAVYTANFTPSTTPLTAISGTSLLTLQSTRFIDNSTNNFAITAVGDSKPSIQNPFGYTSATTQGYTASTVGGSSYFDGTGDYLTVPSNTAFGFGTGDFTIEGWFYFTGTISTYQRPWWMGDDNDNLEINASVIRFGGASLTVITGPTAVANTWYHIAYSRQSGSGKLFVNGTQVGSTTASSYSSSARTVTLMATSGGANPSTGYISDFRIVKGTAIYTSNFVPPTAPLTAIQNTVLLNNMTSAGIYDASTMNNMETVGDAKLSTAISKFGGSSMSFDGTGDRLVSPLSPVNVIGSGDFTIEFWLYPSNTSVAYRALVSSENYPATTGGWSLYQNGTAIEFWMNGSASAIINATSAITAGTWQHLALCRASGTLRLFKDGTSISSVAHSTSMTGQQIWIADNNSSGGGLYFYNGYIDDLRITKGYARYTSNFTAPTSEHKTY